MARRSAIHAACLAGLLLGASPAAQDALPPLKLDHLPAPVRAGLERAYGDARARPRDASAVGRLGMMLHAYEQLESADACYAMARALDPAALSWTYLAGVVHADLGRHADAAASFRRAREIDPDYLPARLRLADSLLQSGALDESRDAYADLIRAFPEHAPAHYGLGRVAAARQRPGDAVEHYRRAVEAAPQFGMAHYALALAYRDAGRGDRAALHLDAYRQLGPRRPAPPDRLLDEVRAMADTARDLIADAARLGRSGRLAESIALHLKALEADPDAAQAHVNLISLYGRTGRRQQAEEHYRRALALGTSLADAHYNYGVMLASLGDRGAADAFRSALAVDPFHAQAHNNVATLLAQEGDLAAAEGHYRQAIASDPQHRTARFNLGRLLAASGRAREAVPQFERILLPDDDHTPRYLLALSRALSATGDTATARTHAEDALARAERRGLTDLARQIDEELQRLGRVPR